MASIAFACFFVGTESEAQSPAFSKHDDSAHTGDNGEFPGTTFDVVRLGVPKLVEANYIELDKIASISKFRSAAGHDYSDSFESCRSMKHYFRPSSTVDWSSVKVFSPVQGTVLRTEEEWAGTKIDIQILKCPAFTLTIFHVHLCAGLTQGDKVAAGQMLGFHVGHQTCSDIAVAVSTPVGRKLVSYFDVMPDQLFEEYRRRGMESRGAAIISRLARDAEPLTCQDGRFVGDEQHQDWIFLSSPR
ncbi:MAG: hypothetical protein ACLQVY_10460 [Limisphaerales bacterium]